MRLYQHIAGSEGLLGLTVEGADSAKEAEKAIKLEEGDRRAAPVDEKFDKAHSCAAVDCNNSRQRLWQL